MFLWLAKLHFAYILEYNMDMVYAIGLNVIQTVRFVLSDYEDFLLFMNAVTAPHVLIDYVAPAVAFIDSVFGAQLYICLGIVLYVVYLLKWLIGAERPYWWVTVTDHYDNDTRPDIEMYPQTCVLSPGCPSAHLAGVCIMVILVIMWISHLACDKGLRTEVWRVIVYPVFAATVLCCVFARLYIAANFLHQCALGIFIGLFLTAWILIFVCDPFLWGQQVTIDHSKRTHFHRVVAAGLVPVTIITYYSAKIVFQYDYSQLFVNAVFSCKNSDWIDERNVELVNIVQSMGLIMGFAYAATPKVDDYRYDTQTRSLLVALLVGLPSLYALRYVQGLLEKSPHITYNLLVYFVAMMKPIVMLNFVPKVAMLPYEEKIYYKKYN